MVQDRAHEIADRAQARRQSEPPEGPTEQRQPEQERQHRMRRDGSGITRFVRWVRY